MKKCRRILATLMLLSVVAFYFSACSSDDGPSLTGESKVYTLNPVSDPSIHGTVTFANRSDKSVLVTIQLSGTQSGNSHPAHIHVDNAATAGAIAVDFTPVDGATGKSETVIKTLNDGTVVSYDD